MVKLIKEEDREIRKIMDLNPNLSFQQAVRIVIERSGQERLVHEYEEEDD